MTFYVHASNSASTAASCENALPWDRFASAGPLAGKQPSAAAQGYNPNSWQQVGAAVGENRASPFQQYDQAWGGCYAGAYAGSYGDCYANSYCNGYGAYGGYNNSYASPSNSYASPSNSYASPSNSYASPSTGGYGPQNAYILNLDQFSDASDSEEEELPKEKLGAKASPTSTPSESKSSQAAEREVAEEPAPEPANEGRPSSGLSPPASPAVSAASSSLGGEAPSADLALLEADVSSASEPEAPSADLALLEADVSSASEPEAEASAQDDQRRVRAATCWAAPSRENEEVVSGSWRRVSEPALKVSASSWAAQQRARRGAPAGDSPCDAEVVRRMKSILNKLTVEKFPVLYQKLISSGIQTAGHAEALIREVFEKATTQHHFVSMYADLCALLQEHFENNPVSDDSKFSFRRLLLNECQVSFERNLAPPSELERLDQEERTLVEFRYKTRMIGNIRFVGALLVRKILASKVMFAIIEELLANTTPEAMESLAVLLTVVGPTFDRPEWTYHNLLAAVFQQVRAVSAKASCCPRARCLLKDLLDLRERGWKDTRPKRCEGPTTLQGVAQQVAAEERAALGRAPLRGRAR